MKASRGNRWDVGLLKGSRETRVSTTEKEVHRGTVTIWGEVWKWGGEILCCLNHGAPLMVVMERNEWS